MKAEIPKELSHLKVDPRGYAVPYFVPIVNGKPEFRLSDYHKTKDCIERNRCHICGKKLYQDYCYVIIGPLGFKNQVTSEAALHRVCAEYALRACPHMLYEKAKRIEVDDKHQQPHMLPYKPDKMILVKIRTKKVKWAKEDENIWRYEPVSHEVYHYVNGILEKKQ